MTAWMSYNKAIRAACKARGIDDEARKSIISQLTGKTSSKDCTPKQLKTVLLHINGSGRGSTFRKPAPKAFVRKIWALWGELKRAGEIRSADTDAALLATVNRHLKDKQFNAIGQLDWLTYIEADPIILELKARVERCKV